MILVLAAACSGGDAGSDRSGKDGSPPDGPCAERQSWPIVDDGHQVDRVAETFDGEVAIHWVPDQPRGLVFVAHADNRNAGALGTLEYEEFYNELAARDLAYFATTSVAGRWSADAGAANPDVQRIEGYRQQLVASTGLSGDVPLFAVGFAGGGTFLPSFANGLDELGADVRGIAVHNATTVEHAPIPAAFVTHANDSPELGEHAYQQWLDAGDDATLHALPEGPLTWQRFLRLNDDDDKAHQWFDDAVAAGLVDEDGNRLVSVDDAQTELAAFETAHPEAGVQVATLQMQVVWRLHQFSADVACEVAQAFEDEL